jgi:hypothetical protein
MAECRCRGNDDVQCQKRRRPTQSLITQYPWQITGHVAEKSVHTTHNCNPSLERSTEMAERSTCSAKVPMEVLNSMQALIRYGVDTNRLWMFTIDNNLILKTDTKSIRNDHRVCCRKPRGRPEPCRTDFRAYYT